MNNEIGHETKLTPYIETCIRVRNNESMASANDELQHASSLLVNSRRPRAQNVFPNLGNSSLKSTNLGSSVNRLIYPAVYN
jgi:hypothetical protein